MQAKVAEMPWRTPQMLCWNIHGSDIFEMGSNIFEGMLCVKRSKQDNSD